MMTSENINELATALAKAQGVMGGALKDSANPFFKSKYADLESVWNACRKALADNALAVIQTTSGIDNGVLVTTRLAHGSGQWIQDALPVYPKDTSPQAIGSAITYGRRYALAAMVGVYQTDDDAEAAHGRQNGFAAHDPEPPPTPAQSRTASAYAKRINEAMEQGADSAVVSILDEAKEDPQVKKALWGLLPSTTRRHIQDITGHTRASGERGARS